jgi:Lon protease-like protein
MNEADTPGPAAGRVIDVRLVPLPNLVMFPGVQQPLRVAEAGGCQLVADALAGDGMVATALLLPGWEQAQPQRAALAATVCLARIVTHLRLPDGSWHVLLAGLQRARIRVELRRSCGYRRAQVRGLVDIYSDATASGRQKLRRALIAAVRSQLPVTGWAEREFERLLGGRLSLGNLTDMLAFSLDLRVPAKQQLLDQPDVDRRTAALIRHLQQRLEDDHGMTGFPPLFSDN